MKQHLVERALTNSGPGTEPLQRGQRSVTVNIAESPLTWLHSRGHLDDFELAAGERLRLDWEIARLAPGITMRWDEVRVSGGRGGLNPTERQMAARARFEGAIASAGPGLSDILWRVVCAGETVPDAERSLSWPVRSGKLVLRFALARVAGYYRIS